MSIFDRRDEVKPYEYPELHKYMKAIRKSMWVIDEFDFSKDVQDFKIYMNEEERQISKRAILAISNIENKVKTFWGKIGDVMPKPEIYDVGYTFAESEVRHQESYSELLSILGFNEEFQQSLQEPALKGRVEYLQKYLKNAGENTKQVFTLNLALFAMFVERVSLFSQFAIIKSFEKKKGLISEISNVIEATRAEEIIHHKFGEALIEIIRTEFPEWFDDNFSNTIQRACKKAYTAEVEILNWIYGDNDLDFCKKEDLIEYIKYTFNECLEGIKIEPIFEIDQEKLSSLRWFINEIHAYNRNDFFVSMSNNYNKFRQVSPFNMMKRLKAIKEQYQVEINKKIENNNQ